EFLAHASLEAGEHQAGSGGLNDLGRDYFDQRDRQGLEQRLVHRLQGLGHKVTLEPAVAAANRMARRNVSYRGATGLQRHLRGALRGVKAS
ncbi:MAG: hypothetical protein AABZ35_04570, partial [Gemmatimonadota bacterium]